MGRMLKCIKIHCTDHINENYVQMLVELKEISNEMHVYKPPEISAPIYTTFTQ